MKGWQTLAARELYFQWAEVDPASVAACVRVDGNEGAPLGVGSEELLAAAVGCRRVCACHCHQYCCWLRAQTGWWGEEGWGWAWQSLALWTQR